MTSGQKTKSIAEVNEDCRQILERLSTDIDKYDFQQVNDILSEFRILTREKTLRTEVLDETCVNLLVDCARNHHIEAQKCISNLILNYAHIRENLVHPYVECVNSRFKDFMRDKTRSDEKHDGKTLQLKFVKDKSKIRDILYYDLRIVFLLSALCSGSRADIRDQLLDKILEITWHEAIEYGKDNHLLIIESLKTLFNLTLDKSINADSASRVIKRLFSMVETDQDGNLRLDSNLELTDQLLVNLIHLLTNMPQNVYNELSTEDVNKVLTYLNEKLKSMTKNNFRDTILPVLNACANICRYKEDVRQLWFDSIINSTTEFDKRPEEYETLRGRLVKLMTSVDVHIKEIAAEFLYTLCGGDVEKFITYTGFGNSAAYLSAKGLLSQSARNCSGDPQKTAEVEDSETEKQFKDIRNRLDPITGKIEVEKKNPLEGMSEEEKEWHAHELASAIAKLSRLGVVKPMRIDSDGDIAGLQPVEKHDVDPEQPEDDQGGR